MKKDYYATAQCFARDAKGTVICPKEHRYVLLKDFDEQTLQMVNENSLSGVWSLLNGKKAKLDFDRKSVSNGRELSGFTPYSGQSYLRTPVRKTFCISREEFLAAYHSLRP